MRRVLFRLVPVLALVALSAILAAGCGGATDSEAANPGEPSAGESSSDGGTVSLVAYSTPREVYEELIPAFQDTDAGAGVEFEQSYAASGEQSRAVEAGLPADYVAFSLEPDMTRLVDAGSLPPTGARRRVQRDGLELGRRLRRPQGQPEEHPDLGRPRLGERRGDHAEPVHLGRRAVEPHGRLRRSARAGQDGGRGGRVPAELLANTPVQDKSAREALQTFLAARAT